MPYKLEHKIKSQYIDKRKTPKHCDRNYNSSYISEQGTVRIEELYISYREQ